MDDVAYGAVRADYAEDVERVFNQGAEVLLAPLQRFDGVFALRRVAHGAQEQITVGASFDEVILGALANGFDGEGFIVETREDDNWNPGCAGMSPNQRVEPALV